MAKDSEAGAERNYDRVIRLIEYYLQVSWLVFGAFILSETVILAGTANLMAAKSQPIWIVAGGLFGLIICIPWWTSFRYNQRFYQLRINQAKDIEKTISSSSKKFFDEGQDFFDGKRISGERMPCYAAALGPRRGVAMLIVLYATAFVGIAVAGLFSLVR